MNLFEHETDADTVKVSAEHRARLRALIVRACRTRGVKPPGPVSGLPKRDLLALAEQVGVDWRAVLAEEPTPTAPAARADQPAAGGGGETKTTPTPTPTAPATRADGAAAGEGGETETAPPGAGETRIPGPDPDPDAVEAAVRSVLQPLGQGDVDGFRAALAEQVRAALRGPGTIVREVVREVPTYGPAPEGVAPYAAPGPARPLGEVVPVLSGHVLGRRPVPTWTGGDPARVPAVDSVYRWPAVEDTAAVMSCIMRGKTVWLYGPAGSGKTTLAAQIAAVTGREFVRVSCTDTTEAQELVGMTAPAAGGGTEWRDGQLTAAIRRPGTLVLIDEPTVARPGALYVLQSVLDSRRLHIAETGEVVPVAPGVVFVLADNTPGTGDSSGQYEGTGRVSRATRDRADAFVRIDFLPEAEEAEVLVARTGCTPALARMLAGFAGKTRAAAADGHVTEGLGLRRLLALAERITDGVCPDVAWRACVLDSSPPADREHLAQMWSVVMLPSDVVGAAIAAE